MSQHRGSLTCKGTGLTTGSRALSRAPSPLAGASNNSRRRFYWVSCVCGTEALPQKSESGVALVHLRAVTYNRAGIFSAINQHSRDGHCECWLTYFVESTPVSIEDVGGDVVAARCDDSLARVDDSDACHRFVADRAASFFRRFVSHRESIGGELNLTR